MTILDPVMCSDDDCQQIFCNYCIESWLKRDKKCPNCQTESGVKKLGRNVLKNFNKQVIKCLCDKTMTYESLVNSHKFECIKKEILCPLDCKVSIGSKD